MDPVLNLAINACVSENVAIINRIIQKIKEVRTFKTKCAALGEHAQLLQALLKRHKSAVESFQTLTDFHACLERIEAFVSSCKSLSVLDVSLEVFVKRTYPALLKEISALKNTFLLESVTEILSREGIAFQNIKDTQISIAQEQTSQKEILVSLRQLNQAELARKESLFSSMQATTPDGNLLLNIDINITFESEDHSVGQGHIEGLGTVVCFKMPSTSSLASLAIYRKIQAGAFVQRFYGIVQRESNFYAIMEYLDEKETLARACKDNSLPATILERVQLAYDLSKTMAWYHRAEMLLKSVSDHTIILKKLPSGRICPILTRLENARHFLEQTSGTKYDSRYEAPEFEHCREHTRYTDIWSLGTAIWQIISGGPPYGFADPVLPGCSEYLLIREKLHGNILPGSIPFATPFALTDIIQQCWKRDPRLRPTTTAIAETLQDLIINLTHPSTFGNFSHPRTEFLNDPNSCVEKVIQASLELIDEARKGTLISTRSKLPAPKFHLLFTDGTSWSPVKYFVVGAVLWWELTDECVYEIGDDLILSLPLGANERRARLSLHFLESAAASGYDEAFLEMYKAHALLATEMKAHMASLKQSRNVIDW
ncbi:kinase-like protein [Hyaloscypha variabilis]